MTDTTEPKAAGDIAIVAPDVLVRRARGLVPALCERGPRADAERMLPRETFDEFGLLRAAQPTRFGGMGHDLEVVADFCQEVARGCGASGWLSSFMSIHQFMVGWFSEIVDDWAATRGTGHNATDELDASSTAGMITARRRACGT